MWRRIYQVRKKLIGLSRNYIIIQLYSSKKIVATGDICIPELKHADDKEID